MVDLGVNVTMPKIIWSFVGVTVFLTMVGIVMQVRNINGTEDNPIDCDSCGAEIDRQVPIISAFFGLISGKEFPMFGLCNRCKIILDPKAVQRIGKFCLIWKEGYEVLNEFEVLLPQLNITCNCTPLFTGFYHPPTELLSVLPCLNTFPSAKSAMQMSSDLSLEALDLCRQLATNFNFSHLLKPARAKVSFSVDNLRIRIGALINRTHHVQSVTVRLTHMTPDNIHIGCDVDEEYWQTCHCFQGKHIQKLIYLGMKTVMPCFVSETFKHKNNDVLRHAAFCYPKKLVKVKSGLDNMF